MCHTRAVDGTLHTCRNYTSQDVHFLYVCLRVWVRVCVVDVLGLSMNNCLCHVHEDGWKEEGDKRARTLETLIKSLRVEFSGFKCDKSKEGKWTREKEGDGRDKVWQRGWSCRKCCHCLMTRETALISNIISGPRQRSEKRGRERWRLEEAEKDWYHIRGRGIIARWREGAGGLTTLKAPKGVPQARRE